MAPLDQKRGTRQRQPTARTVTGSTCLHCSLLLFRVEVAGFAGGSYLTKCYRLVTWLVCPLALASLRRSSSSSAFLRPWVAPPFPIRSTEFLSCVTCQGGGGGVGGDKGISQNPAVIANTFFLPPKEVLQVERIMLLQALPGFNRRRRT